MPSEDLTIEYLTELLEQRDEKIGDLERDNEYYSSLLTWTDHRDVEKTDLPVPRLELRWTKTESRHEEWVCAYSLVRQHLCDHFVAVPLGQTKSSGGRGPDQYGGTLDQPFRESAHAAYDAMHLNLPLFVIYGDRCEQIDPTKHSGAMNAVAQRKEKAK